MLAHDVTPGVLGRSRRIRICSGGNDLAAVPSIGRATRVEGATPPEGDLTRALYEAYANQIFRYCLHQLGSREEAEDAVQSTFLNAFRGLKRGVVPELEAAWLFKIAHNVCLSRRRSSWRRERVESPADFQVVEELTPAPSRGADELIGLQDVLEQMPESQRRAILLREWQGLSYREIAAELELSQGAVETLIFRARRALAAGLEEPPERLKGRLLRGADLGGLVAGLKALFVGGSVAAKVALAVAVVSATTVVAAAPVVHRQHHSHSSTPPRTVVPTPPVRTSRVETGHAVVPATPSTVRVTPVRHPKRAGNKHASTPSSTPTPRHGSAAASKQVTLPPRSKAHVRQSSRAATVQASKVTRPAAGKAHAKAVTASRVSPRHSTSKARPVARKPAPAAGPVADNGRQKSPGKGKGQTG